MPEDEEKIMVDETLNSINYFNKWNGKVTRIFFPPNDKDNVIVRINLEFKRNLFTVISINEILGINDKLENEEISSKNEEQIEYETSDGGIEEDLSNYSGSWASYVEGLSDDYIDDVLDSDPEAYWNID